MRSKKTTVLSFVALLLALTMMLSACTGTPAPTAGTSATTAPPASGTSAPAAQTAAPAEPVDSEPTEISILKGHDGRTYVETEANIQAIMELTNTKLTVELVELGEVLNLRFASGELPDIVQFPAMQFMNYINTGYMLELNELLESNGQNILANTTDTAWKLIETEGKRYVYPYENNNSKWFLQIRQDWLNDLGFDFSGNSKVDDQVTVITLDEYEEIIRQFTENDPDGNGVNDTYGLSTDGGALTSLMHLYGAFGGIPRHGGQAQYYEVDGKAVPWEVSDEYRASLEYINSLWNKGYIDPELFLLNNEQGKQKLMNGAAGSLTAWWSNIGFILIRDGQWEIDPDAEWQPYVLTSNDGSKAGMMDNGLITNTMGITVFAEQPEKVMDFLNELHTDEGWALTRLGIEGDDYTYNAEGYPIRTESGQAKFNGMVMDSLYSIVNRLDKVNHMDSAPVEDEIMKIRRHWLMLQFLRGMPLYNSLFYGLPANEAFDTYGVDVDAAVIQANMSFVTGETPLNDDTWNNYLDTWKRMGGTDILNAYLEDYNAIQGTNLLPGI